MAAGPVLDLGLGFAEAAQGWAWRPQRKGWQECRRDAVAATETAVAAALAAGLESPVPVLGPAAARQVANAHPRSGSDPHQRRRGPNAPQSPRAGQGLALAPALVRVLLGSAAPVAAAQRLPQRHDRAVLLARPSAHGQRRRPQCPKEEDPAAEMRSAAGAVASRVQRRQRATPTLPAPARALQSPGPGPVLGLALAAEQPG